MPQMCKEFCRIALCRTSLVLFPYLLCLGFVLFFNLDERLSSFILKVKCDLSVTGTFSHFIRRKKELCVLLALLRTLRVRSWCCPSPKMAGSRLSLSRSARTVWTARPFSRTSSATIVLWSSTLARWRRRTSLSPRATPSCSKSLWMNESGGSRGHRPRLTVR